MYKNNLMLLINNYYKLADKLNKTKELVFKFGLNVPGTESHIGYKRLSGPTPTKIADICNMELGKISKGSYYYFSVKYEQTYYRLYVEDHFDDHNSSKIQKAHQGVSVFIPENKKYNKPVKGKINYKPVIGPHFFVVKKEDYDSGKVKINLNQLISITER